MRLHIIEKSQLKMPFLIGGGIIGILASAGYLYRNAARQGKIPGYVPDPLWTCLVNVLLIMFLAIYVANQVRRIVEFLKGKGSGAER